MGHDGGPGREGPRPAARAFAANHAVADFVKALPEFAVRAVSPSAWPPRSSEMQKDLRVVRFDVPEPFEELDFWPLGRAGWQVPLRRLPRRPRASSCRRSSRPVPCGHDHEGRLEARPREPQREHRRRLGPKTLERFGDCVRWRTAAEGGARGRRRRPAPGPRRAELTGLHAKLYVTRGGLGRERPHRLRQRDRRGVRRERRVPGGAAGQAQPVRRGRDSSRGAGPGEPRSLLQRIEPPSAGRGERTRRLEERHRRGQAAPSSDGPPAHAPGGRRVCSTFGSSASTLDLPVPKTQVHCWPITLHDDTAGASSRSAGSIELARAFVRRPHRIHGLRDRGADEDTLRQADASS